MDGKAVSGPLGGEFGILADEGEEEGNYLEVVGVFR